MDETGLAFSAAVVAREIVHPAGGVRPPKSLRPGRKRPGWTTSAPGCWNGGAGHELRSSLRTNRSRPEQNLLLPHPEPIRSPPDRDGFARSLLLEKGSRCERKFSGHSADGGGGRPGTTGDRRNSRHRASKATGCDRSQGKRANRIAARCPGANSHGRRSHRSTRST